jgi:prolyl oligopeptidase
MIMKYFFLFSLVILSINICNAQEYKQLNTKDSVAVDTFFNEFIVKDKYRWLENTTSKETKEWVDNQQSLSSKYISKSVSNTNAFNAIDKVAYTDYENPVKMGKYYFTYGFYNNIGVPALFYKTSLNSSQEILVDPNYISYTDKIIIKGYYVSKDSKYLAYQFSRNGSDWAEVKVVSLNDATHLNDHLKNLKFSNLEWVGDGFYYSTYTQDGKFGKTLNQSVYFHKIGTAQDEDKLFFKSENPAIQFYYTVTSDQRYLIFKETNEQLGYSNIFYTDFKSENPILKPLISKVPIGLNFIDSYENKLLAIATEKSFNKTLVEIDPKNPASWIAISPDFTEALLLDVYPFKDRIVTIYQSNQRPIVIVLNYLGEILYKLELPVATSVSGFYGNKDDEEVLFNFESYTIPKVVYKFNINTFKKELTKHTAVSFDFKNIEYKEVECLSSDSVRIPMVLVYRKGLVLDGSNPTILSAYGGFGAISQPLFNPGIVYFVNNGGVYAFANIRGGGDKGINWALAGRGDNKQKSFDDFITAAEFLIENKYTNSQKLAATGGSNGGLVVAAAAIQRPDLFKVVVPIVAPFDMIRFENFTIGHFHSDEYGTVSDSSSFQKLYSYSPYHNIKEDVNYPTMLVITSENDDRVPPFHSYKFVAKLQSRVAQKNPIILKVREKAGHNGATSFRANLREKAELYGFILNELQNK